MRNTPRSLAVGLAERLQVQAEGPDVRPGDLLGTKKELAERFSVSPGTLNEALRIMQLHGLVTLRSGPGGGVFAAAPEGHLRLANLILGFHADAQTMSDAMVVRDSLEPAVWLDLAQHATSQRIEALRGQLRAMDDARANPEDFLRRNWDLHVAAARLCRNRILREAYLGAVDLMIQALRTVEAGEQASPETRLVNVRAHQGLIDAALNRDPELVAAAVIVHASGGRVNAKDHLTRIAAHSTVLAAIPPSRKEEASTISASNDETPDTALSVTEASS